MIDVAKYIALSRAHASPGRVRVKPDQSEPKSSQAK